MSRKRVNPDRTVSMTDPTLVYEPGRQPIAPTQTPTAAGSGLGDGPATTPPSASGAEWRGAGLEGTEIGSYRLRKRIGVGGMGVVYDAVHIHIGRRVAIKLMHPEMSVKRELSKRFQAEAIAATRVGHPHIVKVLDFGQADTGSLYIVMEFLDGLSLSHAIGATGTLRPDIAVSLAAQIAGAMEATHRAGIVHRDLKPDNIFVVRSSTASHGLSSRVLDFGVARFADGSPVTSLVTRDGTLLGTPRYMAPEQTTSASVDHRADIYSLGCIVYHMLCGRPPFSGSLPELLVAHRTRDPIDLRAFNSAVPEALERLTLSMMAKRPEKRPATMAHIATALGQLLPLLAQADLRASAVERLLSAPIVD